MRKQISIGEVTFNIVNYAALTLFTLLCVFPFYYIFINSISDNELASLGKIVYRPVGIHFQNYIKVLQLRGIGQSAFISLARTVLGTLFTLIGSSFLGYTLGKREMWRRKLWYRFVIITMYFNAGIIPWFINMKNLGLVNNFWAYVLPGIVVPFYVILFKTFIESISPAMEESAQIDGAGYLVRFFRIILPLSMPIIATIAVFTAVGQWNAFLDTLFLMRNSRLFTLQFQLYQYLRKAYAIAATMRSMDASSQMLIDPSELLTPISIRMTITMVVVSPILIVYPIMQRFFVKGIMIGAIKG
ncbi:MAG: carbohydrate ABC transporter permease [Spirochaetales bacterium]|nr:carbohydrate ABC transporter permease [Spirochaetales bacterium]